MGRDYKNLQTTQNWASGKAPLPSVLGQSNRDQKTIEGIAETKANRWEKKGRQNGKGKGKESVALLIDSRLLEEGAFIQKKDQSKGGLEVSSSEGNWPLFRTL